MQEHSSIMLVDDDQNDVRFVQLAFKRSQLLNPLIIAASGEECVRYLQGEGVFRNRQLYPVPALILLDLTMPRLDGFEVLKWIRSQPQFVEMRVVVLAGTGSLAQVQRAYELGANSFMVKPLDLER